MLMESVCAHVLLLLDGLIPPYHRPKLLHKTAATLGQDPDSLPAGVAFTRLLLCVGVHS